MYFYYKDKKWLYIALYSYVAIQIHDVIKRYSVNLKYEFLKRPSDAKNCDLFSRNGFVGGKPGFPSGHVTSTVSFFASFYILYPEYRQQTVIIGIVYTVLMAISRINKRCHTITQTVAGAVLGLITPYLFNKLISP
jgi:membrane-associated phospholipid phosphatase